MSARRTIDGRILFHEGDKEHSYSMPDPNSEKLDVAIRRLAFDRSELTFEDVSVLGACVGAYLHFATHPAPTSSIIRKLRELRRAVKERPRKEVSPGKT